MNPIVFMVARPNPKEHTVGRTLGGLELCWCSVENNLAEVDHEPEWDFLKGNHQTSGMGFLGVIPFLIPCLGVRFARLVSF